MMVMVVVMVTVIKMLMMLMAVVMLMLMITMLVVNDDYDGNEQVLSSARGDHITQLTSPFSL